EGHEPDRAVHEHVLAVEVTKDAETMGEVIRYIRHIGAIVIKDGRGKTDSTTVNGKSVRSMSWDARDPQGEIRLHCHMMSGKGGKPALLFVWGSPAGEKKYERELNQILQDIRSA